MSQSKNNRIFNIVLGLISVLITPLVIFYAFIFKLNTTLLSDPSLWYTSISINYYTNASWLMITMIILFGSISLLYPTKDLKERIARIIIFIASIGVVCFPTKETTLTRVGIFGVEVGISYILHLIFASIIFTLSAYIFLFIFPKRTKGQKRVLMIILGSILIVCCLGFLLPSLFNLPEVLIIIFEGIFFTTVGIGYFIL